FAVMVRDVGELRVYLDGRETPELNTASPPRPKDNALIFGQGLQGKLDEVAVFGRALAPAEIASFWKTAGVGEVARQAVAATESPGRIALEELLSARDVPGEWIKIFNGKDLTGFHTHLHGQGPQDPEHVFSVSDGAIHVYKDTPDGN